MANMCVCVTKKLDKYDGNQDQMSKKNKDLCKITMILLQTKLVCVSESMFFQKTFVISNIIYSAYVSNRILSFVLCL